MGEEWLGTLTHEERAQYETAFRFRDWDTVSILQQLAAERRVTENPQYRAALNRMLDAGASPTRGFATWVVLFALACLMVFVVAGLLDGFGLVDLGFGPK